MLRPGLPAAARFTRKAASGAAESPAGEGRGAPRVRALRLRSLLPTSQQPASTCVENRGGRPGFVAGLRDFPYQRGGRVQGAGKPPDRGLFSLRPWREQI